MAQNSTAASMAASPAIINITNSKLMRRSSFSFIQVDPAAASAPGSNNNIVNHHNNNSNSKNGSISSHSHFLISSLWRQRLENLLWVASAAFILVFGDLKTNLVAVLASDPRIHRTPLYLGFMCIALDLFVILYITHQQQLSKKVESKHLHRVITLTSPASSLATTIGFIAFALFSYALWPIWSFLTLPMLFTLFMACIVIAPSLTISCMGLLRVIMAVPCKAHISAL